MFNLMDFHFHLDYYKDFNNKYEYLNSNKIYTLCVTNLPELYAECVKTFRTSNYVKFALGFNPQFAGKEKFNKNLFNKFLNTTKYIGEVGLDYSKEFIKYKENQKEIFNYICKVSSKQNKIFSIHSRNAEEDVLNILIANKIKFAVFHWYSGNINIIDNISKCGYYFSVNYAMTKSKSGIDIIKKIPLDKLLIESDGPFTRFKRQEFSPDNLLSIYDNLERILETSEIKKIVYSNLKKMLIENENSTI